MLTSSGDQLPVVSPEDERAVSAASRPPAGGQVLGGRAGVRRQPVVIANAPFLDDRTPMPTRYWLVGRDLCEAVSRLESRGGVRLAEAAVDPLVLAQAHARYVAERDALVPDTWPGPRPSGGVGGTRQVSSAFTPISRGGSSAGTTRSDSGWLPSSGSTGRRCARAG